MNSQGSINFKFLVQIQNNRYTLGLYNLEKCINFTVNCSLIEPVVNLEFFFWFFWGGGK